MTLPITFGNQASPLQTVWLDTDFQAVGITGNLPCSATGTNVISLTQAANTVTVSGYTSLLFFVFIATGTNTGATTAGVGSLGQLPVFKDSAAGPAALTGGEIVNKNLAILGYDATLNGGTGGFHLYTLPAAGAFLPISGGTLTGPLTATAVTSPVATHSTIVVGGGSPVKSILTGTASLTWSVVAAGSSQDQTISVPGAVLGSAVQLGMPASLIAGILYDGRITSAGVAAVRATNATSGTVVPSGGTFRAVVTGF